MPRRPRRRKATAYAQNTARKPGKKPSPCQRPRPERRRSRGSPVESFGDHVVEADAVVGSRRWSSAPLDSLFGMFGHVFHRDYITSVWMSFRRDTTQTIEYFLTHSALTSPDDTPKSNATAQSGGVTSRSTRDLIALVPRDALLNVCEFLDMFSRARLANTSSTCLAATVELQAAVQVLKLQRFREWPDYRLIAVIRSHQHLTRLNMRNCAYFESFEALSVMANLVNVAECNLSGCSELSDLGVASMARSMPHLTSVDLTDTYVSDAAIEALVEHCPLLTKLVLVKCKHITDHGIVRTCRALSRLQHLEVLDLKSTLVTSDALERRYHRCNLSQLSIRDCRNVRSLSLQSNLKQLRSLNLSFMPQLTTVALDLPLLGNLNLSNCKRLVSVSLRCPSLRSLNMSACNLVERIAVDGPTSLQSANLFQCRAVTNPSVVALTQSGKESLHTLLLCGCHFVTDPTLMTVADDCPNMRTLDVSACKNLAPSLVGQVQKRLRDRTRYDELLRSLAPRETPQKTVSGQPSPDSSDVLPLDA